jgi:transcriptional regulator with XRE-family HTH domain
MVDGSEIGRRISVLRRRKGMTLPDLAQSAGTSKGYLWSLETHWDRRPDDPAPNPGLDVLARLAEQLDVTVADLVGEDFSPDALFREVRPHLPPGLAEFLARREREGHPVAADAIPALAGMKLRGRRPHTVSDWAVLYDAIEDAIDPK